MTCGCGISGAYPLVLLGSLFASAFVLAFAVFIYRFLLKYVTMKKCMQLLVLIYYPNHAGDFNKLHSSPGLSFNLLAYIKRHIR